MIRQTLACALILTLTWTGWAWAAGTPVAEKTALESLTKEQVIERFEGALELLDQLQGEIDRSIFDLEALLERLDYDPERIISYLKREIRFEPYDGLLRGAEGTLMSQAGNSLDQAVLLARLLKDAGYDARIGRSKLSTDQAGLLVEKSLVPPSPRKGGSAEIEKMFGAVDELLTQMLVPELSDFSFSLSEWVQQSNASHENMKARIARESDFLIRDLRRDRIWPSEDRSWREELNQAVSDYFWVEWRDGPGPWTAAHPALSEDPTWISGLQTTETFGDTVPEDLVHQFEFQVVLEQKIADRLEQRPLLQPWRRPVANLVATPLKFINLPNTLSSPESFRELADSLRSASLYTPYFSGSADSPAAPFDVNGNSVSVDALSSAATGVFQQMASNTEDAAAALRGMGGTTTESSEDLVAVSAQWIKYSTISPTGERKTSRRTVLDRVLPSDRAAGIPRLSGDLPLKSELIGFSFMLNPGWIPPTFVMDHAIESARSQVLSSLGMLGSSTSDNATDVGGLWDGGKEDRLILLETFANFDQFEDPEVFMYRPEPSLFSIERHVTAEAKSRVLSDIVWNSRRAFEISTASPRPLVSEALGQGVAESAMEDAGYLWTGAGRRFSAFEFLESARSKGLPFQAVDQSRSNVIETLPVSEARRADLREEIYDGYTVLVPVSEDTADSEEIAWWRIDADTGTTVAVGPGRHGMTVVEYVGISILIGVIIGGYLMFGCILAGQYLLPSLVVYSDATFCGHVALCLGLSFEFASAASGAIVVGLESGPPGWLALVASAGVLLGGGAIAITGFYVCAEKR
jgi:hypothetical protein